MKKYLVSLILLVGFLSACKKETSTHLIATFSLPSCGTNDSIVAYLNMGSNNGPVLTVLHGTNNHAMDFGVVNEGTYDIYGQVTSPGSPCDWGNTGHSYDSGPFQVQAGKGKQVEITQ